MNARAQSAPAFDHAAAEAALDAMFARVWSEMTPPPALDIGEWAEKYRVLSTEESAVHGNYSLDVTPALRGILAACSDRKVRKVVSQKSAQVGYTAGVVCNVLGYFSHWRPSPQIVMFPREKSATDFESEKLTPMIRATKVLADRIQLKSRAQGNSTTRKRYAGGFIKLVASNSPSDVKSTSARVGIVEEPDDTSKDVRGQGNSITLLAERTKTYAPGDFQLIGGTPTAKGASQIEKEMKTTDQRRFQAGCHACGEEHEPEWAHVTIPEYDDQPEREIYGKFRWEAAFYTCPHCGVVWTDDERIEAIKIASRLAPWHGWVPTAKSATPGFFLNELLSTFDGSRVPILAEKYLVAKYEMDRGEPEKMVAFWNSTRGLAWEYKGELPEEDELRERAEDYLEWTCPAGGLVAVMTVDVQHDRLAVTVWVIGRGEEMWLAYWGEHHGQTIVPHQGAWVELEQLMARTVKHATGHQMPMAAIGIDCSDGQTSDATYSCVRKHHSERRPVLALKGAADAVGKVEIWTSPKHVDPNKRSTKATRAGVKVNIVGTAKAKDLILGWAQEGGRVRLLGIGPGRMHWYKGVRDDFFEQLLGEMKIPSRYNPRVREWTERTDRRNEGLDCTVYALYLSRHLRLHLKKPNEWAIIENRLRQLQIVVDEINEDAPEGDVTEQLVAATSDIEAMGRNAIAVTSLPVAPVGHPAAPLVTQPPYLAAASAAAPRPPKRSNGLGNEDWSERL